MRRKSKIYIMPLLYFCSAAGFLNTSQNAMAGDSSQPPSITTYSISVPQNAVLLGLSIGTQSGSVGFNLNYNITLPKGSKAKLHQFGAGLGLGILSIRQGFPCNSGFISSISLMTTSGLPEDVSLHGFGYTFGLSFDRAFLADNNLLISLSTGPLWTSSSSKLKEEGDVIEHDKVRRSLWSLGVSLIVIDQFTLTPGIILGENFSDPYISLMIDKSVTLSFDMASVNERKIPTVSLGIINL